VTGVANVSAVFITGFIPTLRFLLWGVISPTDVIVATTAFEEIEGSEKNACYSFWM